MGKKPSAKAREARRKPPDARQDLGLASLLYEEPKLLLKYANFSSNLLGVRREALANAVIDRSSSGPLPGRVAEAPSATLLPVVGLALTQIPVMRIVFFIDWLPTFLI